MVTVRVLVAFFAGVTGFITLCLVPVSYYGDKSEVWTKRLIIISFVAAVIFTVDVFR